MMNNGYENVLFGIHAYQRKAASLQQVLDAMHVWKFSRDTKLSDVMQHLNVIDKKHVEEIASSMADDSSLNIIGTLQEEVSLITDTGAENAAFEITSAPVALDDDAATVPYDATAPPASNRFDIKRKLAVGGLGEVFIAEDKELRRDIALKCIRERFADNSQFQAKFKVEREITGRLEHPNIVPVYAAGASVEGRPYYAMRYIEGENLKTATAKFFKDGGRTERNSFEFRKLLIHFVDVCNAIEYAHSLHVIHRDIKPHNIMLGKFGETYVVDWGLAKVLGDTEAAENETLRISSDAEATRRGSQVGTPGFMSPEQAKGDIDAVDKASDIYSLGGTLYSIIANQPPIDSLTTPEDFLEKVRTGSFPPPSEINPTVPKPLEAICLRALQSDPDKRYETARALADDVEAWLADKPSLIRIEPINERLARWSRNHLPWAFAGIAFVTLALATFAVGAFSIGRARERTNDQLAINHMYRGIDECEDGHVGQGLAHLAASASLGNPESDTVRSAGIHIGGWLSELGFRMPQPNDVVAVRGTRAEKECVHVLSRDGTLSQWDPVQRRLIRRTKIEGEFTVATFSRDGNRIVLGSLGRSTRNRPVTKSIRIWDAQNDVPIGPDLAMSHLEFKDSKLARADWYGDNVHLALATNAYQYDRGKKDWTVKSSYLIAYNVRQHIIKTVALPRSVNPVSQVTVSPNDNYILTCNIGGEWQLWNASMLASEDGANEITPLRTGNAGGIIDSVTFSPDSDSFWIATSDRHGLPTMSRWSGLDTGDNLVREQLPIRHDSPIRAIVVRRFGDMSGREAGSMRDSEGNDRLQKILLTASNDRSVKWWDVTNHQRMTLLGEGHHSGNVSCADFTSDGIATGSDDGTARVWSIKSRWIRTPLDAVPTMLASSPMSNSVVVGHADGQVKIFKVDSSANGVLTKHDLPNTNGKRSRITSVKIDDAGQRLVLAAEKKLANSSASVKRPSIVQVWSLANSEPQQIGDDLSFESIVFGLALHPTEALFATGGADKRLQIWDVRSQEERMSLELPHWITSVAFDSTGNLLGAGCVDNTARLYRYKRSRNASLEVLHQKIVDAVDFAQIDGEPVIATGSYDYTVELWNVNGERKTDPLSHGSEVLQICFDPLDPTILHTFTTNGVVRRWDVNSGLTIGPVRSFTNKGKDFCVGRGWVAGIGDGDRALYVRIQNNSELVSAVEMPRLTGWTTSDIGQRRLSYDEWIALFENDARE